MVILEGSPSYFIQVLSYGHHLCKRTGVGQIGSVDKKSVSSIFRRDLCLEPKKRMDGVRPETEGSLVIGWICPN